MIFIHESNDITIRFGLGFLEELRLLKESCRSEAEIKEKEFEERVEYISLYQKQAMQMLKSSNVITDMTTEQKEEISYRIQNEMQKLLKKQELLSKELSVNCTRKYESIVKKKLSLAMEYAHTILGKGLLPYVHFINHITNYNKKLQQGLEQCINNYAPSFHQNIPSNDICMAMEMEGLINFMKSFITKARNILIDYKSTVSPTTGK